MKGNSTELYYLHYCEAFHFISIIEKNLHACMLVCLYIFPFIYNEKENIRSFTLVISYKNQVTEPFVNILFYGLVYL